MRSFNGKATLIRSILLSLAVLVPFAYADESDTATSFTIDRPFEVPGMVLQPNTPYVIALINIPGPRNIVQLYNEDQTKMLTTFLAISSDRPEAADQPVFTFIKTDPQFPLPIKEWFYQDYLRSFKFVYPKEQAMRIARYAQEPVLATSTTNLDDIDAIEIETIGDKGPLAQTIRFTQDSQNMEEQHELPATAGELPLMAMTGLLCIGAGLGMKVLSTKS